MNDHSDQKPAYHELLHEVFSLQFENARLRAELQGYRNRKFKTDYEAENARLRERVKHHAEALNEVEAERNRLREQIKVYDRYVNGEMTVSELRNALKETS